jgi:hypothetical protein
MDNQNIIKTILLIIFSFTLSCEKQFSSIENDSLDKGKIEGYIFDNFNHTPIYPAIIKATSNNKIDTTDATGSYVIDSLDIGEDLFVISAIGYDTLKLLYNVENGRQIRNFNLERKYLNISCIPIEDTIRTYWWTTQDTITELDLYPKGLFVRFYPWVSDTNEIRELANKYFLKGYGPLFRLDQQWVSIFCIPESLRSECYFTPNGKKWMTFFGNEVIVEYSFGVFNNGLNIPSGELVIKFEEGVSQVQIDSLLQDNGLRFLHVSPYHLGGQLYSSLVTPNSNLNVLDLGYELRLDKHIEFLNVGMFFGQYPMECVR